MKPESYHTRQESHHLMRTSDAGNEAHVVAAFPFHKCIPDASRQLIMEDLDATFDKSAHYKKNRSHQSRKISSAMPFDCTFVHFSGSKISSF